MSNKDFQETRSKVLFWAGLFGIGFYILAPILFPETPGLRQPELLPVFTLMIGLGQLLRGNADANAD